MTEPPAAAGSEPKLLTVTLTSEDPTRRSEEIAAAVHEYVTVYRDPPRFLVMHPADYAAVSPHFRHERSLTEAADTIAHRVQPSLDRGAMLLADTDDAEWQTPESA
ncbi:MAG: hypothetical protein M3464_17830 [Chloroflexota bacterium]|nr:hypothetical protein [Chloroflexota bacterium]